MLNGQKPIDFKRAVFITENAYLKGSLNYEDFCAEITHIGLRLKTLIHNRNLEKYKTAGNWAAYKYMTDTSVLNYYKPYKYDFNDFQAKKDWTNMFITKLMKTHGGNCHSLPFFYKILVEEIGAKASLALAPDHVYIKHIDENGKWTNIELTSGFFPADEMIIGKLGVSLDAIRSGAYMAPLTEKQAIAMVMLDLAEGYEFDHGKDEFGYNIANTASSYFPNSIPILAFKSNYYVAVVKKENKNPKPDKDLIKTNVALYKRINAQIDSLGYTDISPEVYQSWVADMDREKVKRALVTKK